MKVKKILIFYQFIKGALIKKFDWNSKHRTFEIKINDVFEWGILDNGGDA